ncbi:MAG: hypothetical protein M9913_01425 [Bryobacteraceae bacterium]|nr:hypothetical protein [Bryobacteraceae bacterium]
MGNVYKHSTDGVTFRVGAEAMDRGLVVDMTGLIVDSPDDQGVKRQAVADEMSHQDILPAGTGQLNRIG